MKKLNELKTGDKVIIHSMFTGLNNNTVITRTTKTQIVIEITNSFKTYEVKYNKNTGKQVGYDNNTLLISDTEEDTPESNVNIIKYSNMQVIIKVSVNVLLEKLGKLRAENLMYGNDTLNSCHDNFAGANIYSNCVGITEYNKGDDFITLLVSGHHFNEYKSSIDYLNK